MQMVFNRFISYIKYILICLNFNLKSSFSNKKSLILQTVSMFINNCVWILFWAVIFKTAGSNINGIEMKNILYLWSLPVVAYGICYFLFGGVEDLSDDITHGNLDTYLTQPKYSLISLLTAKSKLSAMGDLIFGLVMGVIAIGFDPIRFIIFILICCITSILYVCIVAIVRLFSFWVGNISKTANVYTNSLFLTLTIYPEKMYSKYIKILMYTVVPAAYAAHIPIKIVFDYNIEAFLVLIAATTFFAFITIFLYNKGLKRYESGNMISRR